MDYALFVRTPAKGITPTSAGRKALQLIRTYLNQTRQFQSELQSQGGDDAGLVRIACYATAAPTFLPPILKSITENFPGISVKVMEGNMMAILDYLENGEVDLVFTYDKHVPPAQAFEPLFSAPPYALISKSDAASQLGSITFEQLSKKPMIMLDLPYTRDYFLELFRARGLEPELSHSTRSSEIAQALVEGDFGYTLLNIQPRTYSAKDSRFRAIPISDSTDVPIFGIATLGNLRQPKNVRSFIKICTQLRDEGVFDGFTVTVPT